MMMIAEAEEAAEGVVEDDTIAQVDVVVKEKQEDEQLGICETLTKWSAQRTNVVAQLSALVFL